MHRSSRSGTQVCADLDTATFWVAGVCVAMGAVAGSSVGWLYGRDQALTASAVPWYAAVGLFAGAVGGPVVSIGSIMTLVATNERAWAGAWQLRCLLTALGAGLPSVAVVEVVSGFSAPAFAFAFCLLVLALPAAAAIAVVDWRARRTRREVV